LFSSFSSVPSFCCVVVPLWLNRSGPAVVETFAQGAEVYRVRHTRRPIRLGQPVAPWVRPGCHWPRARCRPVLRAHPTVGTVRRASHLSRVLGEFRASSRGSLQWGLWHTAYRHLESDRLYVRQHQARIRYAELFHTRIQTRGPAQTIPAAISPTWLKSV
jgi:hypothetical protein